MILIGVVLWFVSGRLGRAVGANCIAAGGIALVVFFAYERLSRSSRQQRSDDHEATLKEIAESVGKVEEEVRQADAQVGQAMDTAWAGSLRRFRTARRIGLIDSTVGRPADLNRRVLAAEKTVDILEISLKTMLNIGAAAWRNCQAEVRIILLDPCFPINEESLAREDKSREEKSSAREQKPLARLRDAEEHQGDGQILKEVNEILKKFPQEWFSAGGSDAARATSDREASGDDPANGTRVKLAQVMPTMSYFRIDGVAYFAPLVHRTLGDETMHVQLEEDGELFTALERHFNQLWEDEDHVVPADPSKIPASYA